MRKAWKKAVSVLLTLVLIFGVLPAMNVSAEGEGGQGSRSIELNFAGTVNGSIVTYGSEYPSQSIDHAGRYSDL